MHRKHHASFQADSDGTTRTRERREKEKQSLNAMICQMSIPSIKALEKKCLDIDTKYLLLKR
jgi:hypothetical protein